MKELWSEYVKDCISMCDAMCGVDGCVGGGYNFNVWVKVISREISKGIFGIPQNISIKDAILYNVEIDQPLYLIQVLIRVFKRLRILFLVKFPRKVRADDVIFWELLSYLFGRCMA